MAMKTQLESLDDVEENLRGEYKEVTQGDKKVYVLDIEGSIDVLPGVKSLKAELATGRINRKKIEETIKAWEPVIGSRKPEEVIAMLDRFPELEALAEGKVDEKKLESLVEGRLKNKLGPLERELASTKTQLGEKDKIIGDYQSAETRRKITGALNRAARDAKVIDSALEDVEVIGERIFELTEDGKDVVTKDGVGVTPGISPKEWLVEMQAKRTHWWGPSAGGGANGGRGGSDGQNPWSAEHWNMTEQGKIVNADPAKADRMAKAAGTTVGGRKPAPVAKK